MSATATAEPIKPIDDEETEEHEDRVYSKEYAERMSELIEERRSKKIKRLCTTAKKFQAELLNEDAITEIARQRIRHMSSEAKISFLTNSVCVVFAFVVGVLLTMAHYTGWF